MYLDHIEIEGFADRSRIVATITCRFGGEEDTEAKLGTVEMTLAQWDALRSWSELLMLGDERPEDEGVGPLRLESL